MRQASTHKLEAEEPPEQTLESQQTEPQRPSTFDGQDSALANIQPRQKPEISLDRRKSSPATFEKNVSPSLSRKTTVGDRHATFERRIILSHGEPERPHKVMRQGTVQENEPMNGRWLQSEALDGIFLGEMSIAVCYV